MNEAQKETVCQKVLAIISSCINGEHIQVATQTVNLVCFEPGVGLTTNQTQRLLDALNKKVDELQQQLKTAH